MGVTGSTPVNVMPCISPGARSFPVFLFTLLAAFPTLACAQAASYPPRFEGSQERVYKTVGDVDLKLWIFTPEGHQASDPRPAAIFFFGGGWKAGNPTQFEQ